MPRVSVARGLMVLALTIIFSVSGTRGLCEQNRINYTGMYLISVYGVSTLDESEKPSHIVGPPAQAHLIFPAPANSDGSTQSAFWMEKFVNQTVDDFNGVALDDSVLVAERLGRVNSLCVAPAQEGAGLECVDLEDPGMYRITPMEVDADCNMITGWTTYTEPLTPGCTSPSCYPMIGTGNITRVDSENVETIALASGGFYSTHMMSVVQAYFLLVGILCVTMF